MTLCQPFKISVSDETLDSIREKVAAYPWHEMSDDSGWIMALVSTINRHCAIHL